MKRTGWSIGRRILAGFGVVAALLCGGLVSVRDGLGEIRALRTELSAIEPRIEAAEALERAVLYRAIALRNLFADPGAQREQDYAATVIESRAALERLVEAGAQARSPRPTDLLVAFDAYGSARDAFAAAYRTGRAADIAATERDLAAVRERVLTIVRADVGELRARRTELRARASSTQDAVETVLFRGVGFVLLALVITAVVTSRAVRRPASRLVAAARALEAGDYGPALQYGARTGPAPADELAVLGKAFARTAAALRGREERLQADARVGVAAASTLDAATLCAAAVDEIADYTGAELAAVYLLDEGAATLRPLAGRGVDGGSATLRLEGLVGDAVARRRLAAIRDVPGDLPVSISLGFASVRPRAAIVAPLVSGDAVLGVLLVGASTALSEDAVEFVERASAQLAIAARNALAHARVTELVGELRRSEEELRARNEELQAQSEEIQAQNEEIQAQSESLQKQAEDLQAYTEELHAQTEELQAQGHEIQEQNDDLRDARDRLEDRARELERVDRTKAEFLAALGHELRNPLAAICNSGHLVELHARDPKLKHHGSVVLRQGRQLRRLVDDLLDLSRINHGKIELELAPVDLRTVVEHAAEATRPIIEARRHRLSVVVPPAPLAAVADPARVQQIVSNLLHNAAKYTPEGGAIEVTAERVGRDVQVRVRDSGIGIAPELLPRIFEPFTQGDHGHKQGLGLGLALVHRLVALHGGHIEAQSAGPGSGSEFRVRLPAGDEEHASEPAAPRVASRAPGPVLRILVVDDNVDLGHSLRDVLELSGHTVDVVEEPTAALAAVGRARYDVALLDIGLPGMTGYELAGRIRGSLPPGDVPRLVAMTGYGQPEARVRALEAGFELHLVKPVDPEDLCAVVEGGGGRRTAAA